MKIKQVSSLKRIPKLLAIISITLFIHACSFNPASDSACKSLLCDGWWADDDNNGEPLIASTGSWTFKRDGTVEHYIGMSGNKETGTWALGITQGIFRNISITIAGSVRNATLEDDNHAYLDIDGCTNAIGSVTLLTHWNDNNKRID